jgi:zinc-ribbon domain
LELFSLEEEAAFCRVAFSFVNIETDRRRTAYSQSARGTEASMFCDHCGASLQTGQGFCSRCGKEVTGMSMAGYPSRSRVQEHVRLLAILWFALSALNALGGVILIILANTLFLHLHDMGAPEAPTAFLHPLLTVVGIFVVAKAAAGFLTGWGLLQRESWARMLALILAFVGLINVPFGTALGVYTLWVLLPAHAEEEYQKYQSAAA